MADNKTKFYTKIGNTYVEHETSKKSVDTFETIALVLKVIFFPLWLICSLFGYAFKVLIIDKLK